MHPCCNGSLQTGTKIIAIVHLVFSILIVLLGALCLHTGEELTSTNLTDRVEGTQAEKEEVAAAGQKLGVGVIVIGVFCIVAGVLSMLLASLLLTGANKRNRTMCMVWFVINVISLVVSIMGTIGAVVSERPESRVGSNIVGMLLECYFLWVVWAFIKELSEEAVVPPHGNFKARV